MFDIQHEERKTRLRMDLQDHPLEGKLCKREMIFSEEEVQDASIPDFMEDNGAGIEDMKTAWTSVSSTLTFAEFQREETAK